MIPTPKSVFWLISDKCKDYIHQFEGNHNPNWISMVPGPGNTETTTNWPPNSNLANLMI